MCRNQEPEFDTQFVTLLIEDARTSLKISQPVNLYVLEPEDEEGNWRTDLRKLQSSNASLTGSYKLAFRDPDHPDYRIYFAKVTSNTAWDEVEPMPPCVVIPATNCLEIFVDHAEASNTDTGTFDVSDPNAKPLEVARHRTANVATTSSNKSGINADVEWLTAELKTLPGYSDFNEHRHKTYFGKPSHIPSRTTKKIQKQSIHAAVGLKSTAFTEAENAVRILRRYGEGGSNPTQAVTPGANLRTRPIQPTREHPRRPPASLSMRIKGSLARRIPKPPTRVISPLVEGLQRRRAPESAAPVFLQGFIYVARLAPKAAPVRLAIILEELRIKPHHTSCHRPYCVE
ncbi:hypothetical protein B0H13DRAFT_2262548 [Mycena leptocephala]|nr:hypothetical protein B0H13DRAFT_2262548 [Mycena leptocephala]